ncbi:DUF2520 domain-containing protein [Butyricicoccus sp. OF10-2]|nr:DUF2520 domain-containing protein [Butyricicoccus sp. OF10-2]
MRRGRHAGGRGLCATAARTGTAGADHFAGEQGAVPPQLCAGEQLCLCTRAAQRRAAERLRISETDALHALAPLMRSNLAHVIEHGAVSALTGPIERGDTQTVQKHLSCLTERDDRQLYALLGLEQVKMAQEKHPEQDYGTLAALLNREKEQKE